MMSTSNENGRLIRIGKKVFFSAFTILFLLILVSILLTYIIPKGTYGTVIVNGEETVDYGKYIPLEDENGIGVIRGLLSPFLNLGTSDGLTVIVLSVFLLSVSGVFQAMNDFGGIRAIVVRIVRAAQRSRKVLVSITALTFMVFGAFLGLFEEMLTLLPITAVLMVSMGYDSFVGFLVSVGACGFGFASAITNPFTVLFASDIIGVSPLLHVWYRIVIFAVMYMLLLGFIFLYIKKIRKDPASSLTFEQDRQIRQDIFRAGEIPNEKKIFVSCLTFLLGALACIILCTVLPFLRDYTVVVLTVYFLFFGLLTAMIATEFHCKDTFRSFLKGVLSALPSILFVLMAASVKYILTEGHILPTISNGISRLVAARNIYQVALILFGIVLILEFFISSSTAKAMAVMSVLSVLPVGLTKQMEVLIYTFGDGYTNLLFPTSPVLLIGLSMIGVPYLRWVRKSLPLFAATFLLVIAFIFIGIRIGY